MSVLEVPQVGHLANQAGTTIIGMKVTKSRAARTAVLILLLIVSMIVGAQSSTDTRGQVQQIQPYGYWVDPSTGLMWTGKDNGKAVTWHNAESYCRNLRLGGYRPWRLATLDELASLVDKSTSAPQRSGSTEPFTINLGRHVRGNLSLTGDPWSSNRDKNRFGHPYGDGAFFDFVNSKP